MLATVHQGPPLFMAWADAGRVAAGKGLRTGVNERRTEPSGASALAAVRRISPRDRLDAFQLPYFFLVVGCPVQVECELAVEPELGGGAERLGQPSAVERVMPRLPLSPSVKLADFVCRPNSRRTPNIRSLALRRS
jgi:hypothetical protein